MKENIDLIVVFFIFVVALSLVTFLINSTENNEINSDRLYVSAEELMVEQTTEFMYEGTAISYENEEQLAEEIIANDEEYGVYKNPIKIENLNTDFYKKLEAEVLKITTKENKAIGNINIETVNYYFDCERDKNSTVYDRCIVRLNLNCPKISGLPNKEIENKINNELKNIAFSKLFYNGAYFDYVGYTELLNEYKLVRDKALNEVRGYELDYKVNILEDRYLSIMFEGNTADDNNVNTEIMLATFDLKSGNRVYLNEYTQLSGILMAVRNRAFESYYGADYGPDGISKAVQARVFPQRIEKSCYNEEENCYDEFCANNFYADEENIYIKFPFARSYSLDGLIVLRLDKEVLDNSNNADTEENKIIFEQKQSTMGYKNYDIEKAFEDRVDEIKLYKEYVKQKSGGEVELCVDCISEYPSSLNYKYNKEYYSIKVYEKHKDYSVPWDYFYIREDYNEILWENPADIGYVYPLDKWRENNKQKNEEIKAFIKNN